VGWLAVLLGACSAAGAAAAILGRADTAVVLALEPLADGRPSHRSNWVDRLERLGRTRLAGGSRELVRRRLELAGNPWPLDAVLGLKVAMPAAGMILCLALVSLGSVAALSLPPVMAAGFRGPEFVTARLARRRQARLAGQVPDFGELLLATTQAGLAPPVAFRRSSEALGSPLGEELAAALRQVDLGVPWRTSLEEVAGRVEDPSFRRLVSALTRSQRLGNSLTAALRSVADDLRGERRAVAEERARRAPVKMLFPLVFLILPAFLLLTVGPVVLATIRSLR
jgi:tight adherence protein C